MSFDKPTRNLLAKTVAACRDLLAVDIADQLQSAYGLYPDGTQLEVTRTEAERRAAQDLRALLAHYQANLPQAKDRPQMAYQRLVREAGFTLLNRLAAMRLCEERGLVIECVRQGMESDGFRLYDMLAGGALGNRHQTYRAFLENIFAELARDLGGLFERSNPLSHLFPSETALSGVLDLLNDPELARRGLWAQDETIGWMYQYYNDPAERKKMRDESQAPRNSRELAVRNQFFTPRYVVEFLADNTLGRLWHEMTSGGTTLKDTCRYLVRKPREVFLGNSAVSHEQAPEWVKAILERADFTRLSERPSMEEIGDLALVLDGYAVAEQMGCGDVLDFANQRLDAQAAGQPLPADSLELWLILFAYQRGAIRHGFQLPEAKDPTQQNIRAVYKAFRAAVQSETDAASPADNLQRPAYLLARALKDPRDLKILDPACGSGHFLLYVFNLLLIIYEEAWSQANLPPFSETGTWLARDYATLEDLRRAVPELILRHNLYGVDIDPRAAQIAALALWLRAQRAWQEMGVKAVERPQVTRTNIVVAEPMPGDECLLEEFIGELKDVPFIGQLVRVVFEKMKLAGEAGSLLKIEVDLREAIAAAKSQWLARPQPEQLGLWAEPTRPHQEQLRFDLSGISDEQFWQEAEGRALAALSDYASQAENGQGTRRRLFAGEAGMGFAFVDLCRKQFDVVLMNPPFGEASKNSIQYIETTYPSSKNDVYAAFIERFLDLLFSEGQLGAITSRTGFFLSSFQKWRENILFSKAPPVVFADLGSGVLDAAMVETATYVLQKKSEELKIRSNTCFIRLLGTENKDAALFEAIYTLKTDENNQCIFWVDVSDFQTLPGSTFAYWVNQSFRNIYKQFPRLEGEKYTAKQGLVTADDFRFLRLYWEVLPEDFIYSFSPAESKKSWIPFAKGGPFSPFYADINLILNWRNDGVEIKNFANITTGKILSRPQNIEHFLKPGLTWPARTNGLSFRPLPKLCAFSHKGPAILSADKSSEDSIIALMAIINSSIAKTLVSMLLARTELAQSFEVGVIQQIPIPINTSETNHLLINFARRAHDLVRQGSILKEISHPFSAFPVSLLGSLEQKFKEVHTLEIKRLTSLQKVFEEIDKSVAGLYGVETVTPQSLPENTGSDNDDENETSDYSVQSFVDEFFSYLIGCIFGRWDIRISQFSSLLPKLPEDLFAPLPVCSPATLVATNGLPANSNNIASEAWLKARPDAITLPEMRAGMVIGQDGREYPATIPDSEYLLPIPWDGILVDDPGLLDGGKSPHPEDIVERVQLVLRLLWPENHTGIEAEACEILGVRELRDYFRKPGGFFADHLKRYSKSRRQAPIYWPLSIASGAYTLWLYYPRLSAETLPTAINRFVAPKIDAISDYCAALEARLNQISGRANTDLRDELDRQKALLAELRDFRAELLRISALPYQPDLNDGVILNAAPFHRLFRLSKWSKDTEAAWKKLAAGEYDWSHIAYVLWPDRVREACKTDKSIAIAHGLEGLYVDVAGKKGKGRKSKTSLDELDLEIE
ncbi:MAG: BREX-1 system adenine-specific DNA-methyltransferase PglX [Chloroflexi bacterium]|nr:BREX-1 system adenine-specific DNA-methyltransferase PglX [Chloroflexota bacterium]